MLSDDDEEEEPELRTGGRALLFVFVFFCLERAAKYLAEAIFGSTTHSCCSS